MPTSATGKRVDDVVDACRRYGQTSIIALSGAPATGKSHVAIIAAQKYAGHPTRVKEIQFHQAFTYEEFMEGLRIDSSGAVVEKAGVFLEWNDDALADIKSGNQYVLLIEELTRANIAAVLGELLTYVEHRERQFETLFSRRRSSVATNLTILATFNPVDRSALSIDDALLRRLRIIDFQPDTDQLEEMLATGASPMPQAVISALKQIFENCRAKHLEDYETLMPFGHGIFKEVKTESDLHPLWHQRIKRILRRPLQDSHPFADTIEQAYPWRNVGYKVPAAPPMPGPPPGGNTVAQNPSTAAPTPSQSQAASSPDPVTPTASSNPQESLDEEGGAGDTDAPPTA